MKVYTKTGDTGTTALFGGSRVHKDHIRIESYGTVDELNSHLGLLRDCNMDQKYKDVLIKIQNKLFTVGAILATPPEKEFLKSGKERLNIAKITEEDISYLEKQIDEMEMELPQMTHFVLPGGHQTVSICHIGRCVCRRAERLSVHLDSLEPIDGFVIKYLNRLSDYLFVLARKLTLDLNVSEVQWIPEKH